MNILLVNVPSRKGKGGVLLPLGLLYVGAIIERCGHKVRIFDPYFHDVELRERIVGEFDRVIEEWSPSVIGFGGIATSYGRAKQLASQVRKKYPGIYMIAGGALSSVSELLLKKTDVDLVFHGETETSLPLFLQAYDGALDFDSVPGISYRSGKEVVSTGPASQVDDLDSIPYPAYHLVNMEWYFNSIADWLAGYEINLKTVRDKSEIIDQIGTKKHYIPIVSSRGCTHRCLFCYRHMKGHRQHSVRYMIEHIKFLQENYGVKGFQFCDELFNASRSWVMQFCDAIERERIDIFYLIGGARVDRVDEEMLFRLKQTGCIEINYGQESGSDTILKEYRKGTTSQQNKDVTILTTKKVGLSSPVQIVIGSPKETRETINDTIALLKAVEAYQYSINYLIPLPGTPVWEYVEKRGLVNDVEKFLDLVAENGGAPLLNLTEVPDKTWRSWTSVIAREMGFYSLKKRGLRSIGITHTIIPLIPRWLKTLIKRFIYARGKR